jgi:hypothetical protein
MEARVDKPDKRLAQFVKALSQPDDAACQACVSQLDGYVAAQLRGDDYQAQFPDVAMHLDACLDCAGAYARHYELELAESLNQLPQPSRAARPDLGFLRTPAPNRAAHPQSSSLVEQLREAVRQVGNRITLQLSPVLFALMQPAPAALALRAPADAERYGEVLLDLDPHEPPHPEAPFGLTAYRDARQPGECLVEITLAPPGREWPDLSGLRVALLAGSDRRVATTDAWGLVSFEGVPVSQLADLSIDVDL